MEKSLENYNKTLRQLAANFYRLVVSEMKQTPWTSALLDVRYAEDGSSWIDKLRVKASEGQLISLRKGDDIRTALSELSDLRSALGWYSLKLNMGHDKQVTINYDHDPKSAEDPSFYDD